MTRAKSAAKREGSAAKAGHALSPSLNLRLIWCVRGGGRSRARGEGSARGGAAEREGRCTWAGADHRDDRHDVRP